MIINRYIFKEIANSFAATLLILTLIIVGNTFVRLLSDASSGALPVDLIGDLLGYNSLKQLIRLIPVALLIGMMLAFSRLYRDSEMSALQAAGVSPRQFYRAIYSFVLPLTALMAVLILVVSPWLESQDYTIRSELKARPEAAGIPAGEFVSAGSAEQNYTTLTESIDATHTVMNRFFVRLKNHENEVLIWADSALLFVDSVSGERVLQIHKGYRYETDAKTGVMNVVQFKEHSLRIPLHSLGDYKDVDATPTAELLTKSDRVSQTELQWRASIILSAPILALLAFPLSYTPPRAGRYSKIAVAILIYAVYANVLATLRGMMKRGSFPLIPGMWWVHLVMIALSLWLLHRYYGKPR